MKDVTTYYSAWDWLPWSIILFTIVVCLIAVIPVNMILALTIAAFLAIMEVAAFLGTYYEIRGGNLIVHSWFKVSKYPIMGIKSISPTNSWLAAPAASLGKRIAITFDRSVTGNCMPLIISPVRQSEFISLLSSINPDIEYHSEEKSRS
ncbi:MAG: PH domain-containing protein [Muribaculaceae bacterium]|nr:PH domain-containing protein [Muribaculaceae bacterium]